MASSVEQIAARLRHVLDGVGAAERAVQHGLTLIRQAAGSFAQVMRGSAADEPNDVAAQLASAQRTLTETHATLAAITGHIINYLAILGHHHRPRHLDRLNSPTAVNKNRRTPRPTPTTGRTAFRSENSRPLDWR